MLRYPPNPCQDCQDRYVGCHSTCERHVDWQRRKNEEKQKLNDSREADDLIYAYTKESRQRGIQRLKNHHVVGTSANKMSKGASGVIDPNLDLESYS